jgi:DNA-binding protein HU-beta
MNKSEFIHAFAANSGLKIFEAENVLEAFIMTVTEALKAGEDVKFIGFGGFAVVHKEKSVGRNPRTGKVISIPAHNVPKFKAGKELKNAVNSQDMPLLDLLQGSY